jgi:NAD(P)-dependent dehydrogenase (short-subunit alcohol dehydrogenase family)
MSFPTFSDRPLEQLVSLAGRTAVVTGAGRGIGAGIARRFAEAGATLHLLDKRGAELHATAEATGGTAHEIDILDHGAVRAFADHLGTVHVWVNDAGILPICDAFDIDEAEWRRVVDVNLTATFFACQAAGRIMRDGGGGAIVNIASSLAFHSVKRQPHYVASKWAVRGLTAALANDWGQYNIRVVAIGPGLTDTEGVRENMAGLDDLTGGDARAATSKMYAAGRLGEPDDIARAVLFAASDLGGFVTASTILADGGEVYAT